MSFPHRCWNMWRIRECISAKHTGCSSPVARWSSRPTVSGGIIPIPWTTGGGPRTDCGLRFAAPVSRWKAWRAC